MERGAEGKVVQTWMSSFTIARAQEIMPKIDKLRNNSALLRSMQVSMREKAKKGLKLLSVDSTTEGGRERDCCSILNLRYYDNWVLCIIFWKHELTFKR